MNTYEGRTKVALVVRRVGIVEEAPMFMLSHVYDEPYVVELVFYKKDNLFKLVTGVNGGEHVAFAPYNISEQGLEKICSDERLREALEECAEASFEDENRFREKAAAVQERINALLTLDDITDVRTAREWLYENEKRYELERYGDAISAAEAIIADAAAHGVVIYEGVGGVAEVLADVWGTKERRRIQ